MFLGLFKINPDTSSSLLITHCNINLSSFIFSLVPLALCRYLFIEFKSPYSINDSIKLWLFTIGSRHLPLPFFWGGGQGVTTSILSCLWTYKETKSPSLCPTVSNLISCSHAHLIDQMPTERSTLVKGSTCISQTGAISCHAFSFWLNSKSIFLFSVFWFYKDLSGLETNKKKNDRSISCKHSLGVTPAISQRYTLIKRKKTCIFCGIDIWG